MTSVLLIIPTVPAVFVPGNKHSRGETGKKKKDGDIQGYNLAFTYGTFMFAHVPT